MRLSLVSKLTSAWLSGITVLGIVLATAIGFAHATSEAQARVTQSYVVLDSVSETFSALEGVESGRRGYLLTGDRRELRPYWRGMHRVTRGLAALRRLAGDEPTQQARITRLERLARTELVVVARAVALADSGRADEALAQFRADSGAALMDSIRAEFDGIRAVELGLLATRTAALERASARTLRVMWSAGAIAAIFAPLGYLAIVGDLRARRRAEEALAEQSITDELTGLLNRRGLDHVGAHALAHAYRSREPALLLYLDMNGFKAINDECGHAAGDAALRDTAAALRSVFRESDVIARAGGDEFVVLACDARPEDAGVLAKRIAHALKTRSWHDAPYAPHLLRASIGVAAFDPTDPVDLGTLVHEADASMYAVKHLARVGA